MTNNAEKFFHVYLLLVITISAFFGDMSILIFANLN
jgi:hypothetical protein